jgi:hypothetical protein
LPVVKDDLYIDFTQLNNLIQGKNPFIDFICDKIISGEDFILPDKLVDLTQVTQKDQIREFA